MDKIQYIKALVTLTSIHTDRQLSKKTIFHNQGAEYVQIFQNLNVSFHFSWPMYFLMLHTKKGKTVHNFTVEIPQSCKKKKKVTFFLILKGRETCEPCFLLGWLWYSTFRPSTLPCFIPPSPETSERVVTRLLLSHHPFLPCDFHFLPCLENLL